MPPEAIACDLRRGTAAYEAHLHARPTIFGRRRFGLTRFAADSRPTAPGRPALHAGRRLFSGGPSEPAARWEGLGSVVLEMLSRVPLDAGADDTFLPSRATGEALDLDHTATVVFAHWPGQASPWYRDLQRVAYYTRAGRLHHHRRLFPRERAFRPAGQLHRRPIQIALSAADGPAAVRDSISRWSRYYHRRTLAETTQTLAALNLLLGGVPADGDSPAGLDEPADAAGPAGAAEEARLGKDSTLNWAAWATADRKPSLAAGLPPR